MPSKIADYLNWAPQTVRETIHRWNSFGLGGLWEAPGRGGKTKWREADIVYLEQCLQQEPNGIASPLLRETLLQGWTHHAPVIVSNWRKNALRDRKV